MKEKPNCQFSNGECSNPSTVKWGDHWFCDQHAGDRARSARATTQPSLAQDYVAEIWPVEKDAIYASEHALKVALPYVKDVISKLTNESLIKAAQDDVRHIEKALKCLKECGPESPLLTTQPQAKGEFGDKLTEFRDIVLHSRGLLAEDPNNDTLNAVLHEFDLLFPDLTKVAVVDNSVLETVKIALVRFKNPTPEGPRCEDLVDSALEALAKLNAGGEG